MLSFVVERKALQAAVNGVAGAASTNRTLPVLNNIRLSADGDGLLKLAATNLEVGVETALTAEAVEAGGTTVEAKALARFLRTARGEFVTGVAGEHNQGLKLTSGGFSLELVTIPAEEFPNMPRVEGKDSFPVPAAELVRLLSAAVVAAGAEKDRPTLAGVCLTRTDDGSLTAAATDGYRLVVVYSGVSALGLGKATSETRLGDVIYEYGMPKYDEATKNLIREPSYEVVSQPSVIIPTGAVKLLAKALRGYSGDVTLTLGKDKQLFVEWGQTQFTISLIDARFPDWRTILPTKFKTEVVVERKALWTAVGSGNALADRIYRRIELKVTPGKEAVPDVSPEEGAVLSVSLKHPEWGASLQHIPVKASGPGLSIGCDVNFLVSVLPIFPDETVCLRFTEPNRPLEVIGGDTLRCVIMPMLLPAEEKK